MEWKLNSAIFPARNETIKKRCQIILNVLQTSCKVSSLISLANTDTNSSAEQQWKNTFFVFNCTVLAQWKIIFSCSEFLTFYVRAEDSLAAFLLIEMLTLRSRLYIINRKKHVLKRPFLKKKQNDSIHFKFSKSLFAFQLYLWSISKWY